MEPSEQWYSSPVNSAGILPASERTERENLITSAEMVVGEVYQWPFSPGSDLFLVTEVRHEGTDAGLWGVRWGRSRQAFTQHPIRLWKHGEECVPVERVLDPRLPLILVKAGEPGFAHALDPATSKAACGFNPGSEWLGGEETMNVEEVECVDCRLAVGIRVSSHVFRLHSDETPSIGF